MNFAFTPEQETLRAEARRFLSERVDLRAQLQLPGARDPALWSAMDDLGWLDTDLPALERCILIEEAARVLLPGPFLHHHLGADARPDSSADLTRPYATPLAGVAHDTARVFVAADLVGVAGGALHMAVAYANEREQFGHPIGSFQAIKHMCADMARALEAARLAVYHAAWTIDARADDVDADDINVAARTAKALANDAAMLCAAHNIQIHGGIGVTWEHDAHLYYRRALTTSTWFGTTAECLDVLAASALD